MAKKLVGAHPPVTVTNEPPPPSAMEVRKFRDGFHSWYFHRWYSRKYLEDMEKIKKNNTLTEQLLEQKLIELEEEQKKKHRKQKKDEVALKEWMNNKTKLKEEKRLREREIIMKSEEERNERKKISKEAFEEWLKNHPKVTKTPEGTASYFFRKITYKDSTTRPEPSMINNEIWRNP